MKKDQELIVITKTYDLILWSCNHTSKFPRNHRFVLGERIERNLYNLLETLIRAKYTKNRQRLLEEANLSLEVLRFQMRLAKDLQCLKVESYAFAAKSISSKARDQRERLSLLMVDLAQAIVHSCGSPILRSTCQLSGALGCVMLCLTASPPLTVLSVITYLTPASASNKTPSKTSSTTDLEAPWLPSHAPRRSGRSP